MGDLPNIPGSGKQSAFTECSDTDYCRYLAFNSVLRWQTKRLAGFYVSRNEEDRQLSAGDIAELLDGSSKQLADRVRRQAATLTGTPPYWAARSKELAAMIWELGTPHAFITVSAADIQWPDLH
jgi:ATP-dependent DNA helicase PIF1